MRSREELESRAHQVVMAIRSLRFADPNAHLRASVSVGAALCSDQQEWSHWYSEADSALYEIKGQGGDGYHLVEAHD